MADGRAEPQAVSDAINAITRANLAGAVTDRQQLRDLVNDYFLFDDQDDRNSDKDSDTDEENIPLEDTVESDEDEDPPLLQADPIEQVLDDEKKRCENFR